MHSFAAGGSGKILHWSFNEQNGGFIGDSAGVHKAIAYGYERDNGCMNFSDGKIYYLSRYVAGELKGQSAFSVYARFTAKKMLNLIFSACPASTRYMLRTDS